MSTTNQCIHGVSLLNDCALCRQSNTRNHSLRDRLATSMRSADTSNDPHSTMGSLERELAEVRECRQRLEDELVMIRARCQQMVSDIDATLARDRQAHLAALEAADKRE
jgi:hypothetical protein